MTDETPHPFEIFWDPEEESYFMFCPEGCVLVGGKAATNDEIENGNLRLDFGASAPDKVYLHVSKKEAEEGEEEPSDEWEFSVDGSPTKTGASYNVLVARFGESENDGNSYDVVCSAISLGGTPTPTPTPTPISWDVRENPDNPGSYQVFDPVAYVMVENDGNVTLTKKPLKVVATGKKAGEWNYARLDTVDGVRGVYCVITATVSSSGKISYECQNDSPMAKASILSVCMATVTQVEDVDQETGETVVKSVLKQVRRGAPSVVGLGMPDRASISLNDRRETEIKGFKSQSDEADKLAELLSRSDSEDEYAGSVLVRMTDEDGKHKLVYVPIGKGIGGDDGGSTTGYTGTIDVPTGNTRCNKESGFYIQNEYATWTFENGLLTSVGSARWPRSGGLATTPLSEEL